MIYAELYAGTVRETEPDTIAMSVLENSEFIDKRD